MQKMTIGKEIQYMLAKLYASETKWDDETDQKYDDGTASGKKRAGTREKESKARETLIHIYTYRSSAKFKTRQRHTPQPRHLQHSSPNRRQLQDGFRRFLGLRNYVGRCGRDQT